MVLISLKCFLQFLVRQISANRIKKCKKIPSIQSSAVCSKVVLRAYTVVWAINHSYSKWQNWGVYQNSKTPKSIVTKFGTVIT